MIAEVHCEDAQLEEEARNNEIGIAVNDRFTREIEVVEDALRDYHFRE